MKTNEEIEQWALGLIRSRGYKMTEARSLVVRELSKLRLPVSIKHLSGSPGIAGACDMATLYRTLLCLMEAGVAREVHLTNRISHFVLIPPGSPHDFLICDRCGFITLLPCEPALHEFESRASTMHGFISSRHQLEIHGICSRCQEADTGAPSEPARTAACVGCLIPNFPE